jgi:hypothetical protein
VVLPIKSFSVTPDLTQADLGRVDWSDAEKQRMLRPTYVRVCTAPIPGIEQMAVLGNSQFYVAIDTIAQLISRMSSRKTNKEAAVPSGVLEDEQLIDARRAITEIQETYESLVDAKLELEEQVMKLKAWGEDKSNYKAKELAPGIPAYAKTPVAGSASPVEWLCPRCFHNDKKAFFYPGKSNTHETRNCHDCGLVLDVGPINFFRTTAVR